MTRERIMSRILRALAVAVASAAGVLATTTPAHAQPNIVFVLSDDLGWGDLSCYGHAAVKTPNIDALAEQGTLFTQYYASAPVCSPARAAILTGRHPAEVGVYRAIDNSYVGNEIYDQIVWLPPSPALLPRRLQDAGYATAHFGKWHLGNVDEAPLLDEYGFDAHRSTLSAEGNPMYPGPGWRWKSSDWIVDDAIAFMNDHAEDPFYVQLWLKDPHAIVDPSPEQAEKYSGGVTSNTFHTWTSARHCYMSAVTAMDDAVGRLLDEIDALGLANDTIVVFASDNGPESQYRSSADHSGAGHAGPFRGRKRSVYEGGVRVPCIVRWPGHVPAGAVSDATIAAVDWLPTLASIAGLPPSPGAAPQAGEDVSDALEDVAWTRTKPLFFEWRFGRPPPTDERRFNISPGGAVVVGDWKLLRNRDGSRVELYNLAEDPMEVQNVAPLNPRLADTLSTLLVQWQSTCGPCVSCQHEGDNSYPWP